MDKTVRDEEVELQFLNKIFPVLSMMFLFRKMLLI